MQRILLILFLLLSQIVWAQRGFLYVKKQGFKKVRTFEEGAVINFKTKDGQRIYGFLALVKNDSIFVNGHWFDTDNISSIQLRGKSGLMSSFLLTTAGVGLSTLGMSLAKWDTPQRAFAFSAGIGYTNLLLRNIAAFKRKSYRIGKKFSLQTLDLHF